MHVLTVIAVALPSFAAPRPAALLAALLLAVVVARLVWAVVGSRRRRRLVALAAARELRFSPRDRFLLKQKVQAVWHEVSGRPDVIDAPTRLAVSDVLYRNRRQSLECFCTVRFAEPDGHCGRRVARLLVAPRADEVAAGVRPEVTFGAAGGDLVHTYERLIDEAAHAAETAEQARVTQPPRITPT